MTRNSPYVLPLAACDDGQRARVGGKNTGLGVMIRAGVPVPPGFAVTTDAYRAMLSTDGIGRRIAALLDHIDPDDITAVAATSETVRNLIEGTPVPDTVDTAVRAAYEELCASSVAGDVDTAGLLDIPVAVRSSATSEDLSDASFAGQQDTFLWVTGADDVVRFVRKCWSSLHTARAIVYRAQRGFPHDEVAMSTCVQKMVDARVAGVMFTLNPLNGDRSKVAIDASWGLGEAVAAGEVTPDNYLIDKITRGVVRRTISVKNVEYRPNRATRRVERRGVSPERSTEACLTDEELADLTDHARAIEAHFGRPQDLEWAIDADLTAPDNIVLLQSRPETVWSERDHPSLTSASKTPMDRIVDNLVAGVRIRGPGEETTATTDRETTSTTSPIRGD